jgi:hypothetical protein
MFMCDAEEALARFLFRIAFRCVLCALCVLCFSSAAPAAQSRRPAGTEWEQIKPLFTLVQETASGQPAPHDVTLEWHCHFVNADAGVVLVPFTLVIKQGEFSSFPLAMYVRIVARGAPAPAPGPRDALAQYPFEDAASIEHLDGNRITRAFTAPPGAYDVYIAIAEGSDGPNASAKRVVLKQPVDVPDFDGGLGTSSIIVAENIAPDRRGTRPTFEEQLDDPYALWGMRITPAITNVFRKDSTLSFAFVVYNTANKDDKPDVEVRYTFHRRQGAEGGAVQTRPEMFNARTLRPEFSLNAGDLIVAGREIPLAQFDPGEYRLEIEVFDRIGAASVTRAIEFVVAGP